MVTGKGRRGRGWLCGGLLVAAVFLALAFAPVGVVRAATVTVPDCMGSSLATAISSASAGDTITFAQDCPTATPITLTSTQTIGKNLTIDGTGHQVTIDGGNTVRLFTVSSGVSFAVNALTLTGGNAPGDFGGAINNSGTLTVTNSTLSGNSAPNGGGGGIFNGGITMTVTNSTFSGNSASNGGGGIYNGGPLTVTNSTLSGNSTPGSGGGILNYGALTVTNSTLSGNSASIGGGGIANKFGTLNATNTLIVNSTSGGDVSGNGINGTNSHNLIGSFTFATPLQNNGGPTQTLAIPTPATPTATDAYQGGNLATCNAIAPTGTPAGVYDQRGAPRVVGGTCSIGAYEPGPVTTTTALTATPTSGAFGTPVTFTAAVRGVRGDTPPDSTNAVTFTNGITALGTANLVSGTATFPTSSLPPGNSVTATYSGGTNYAASTSNAVSVTITATAATTAVTSSSMGTPPTSTFGQSVTFTATVTGVSGTAPTGTVQFASTPMGGVSTPFGMPVMLTAGMGATATATIPTTALPVGTDTITATYSGDGNYVASSGTVTQTVTKAVATTSVTATPATSTFGQSVTFTATIAVTAPGAGTPTGTVAFTLGGITLGSGTVNGSGVATFATTALPVGTNQTVTATYSGDGNVATSSGTASVTVNPVTIILTAPTGTGSGNSGSASAPSIRAGGSITLGANPSTGVSYTSSNANVAAVDPITGQVTGIAPGTVTITVNGPNGSSGSITLTVTGGTGGGLVAPAPGAHPAGMASTAGAGATPFAAPSRKADGTGSSGSGGTGGVQPQAAGATAAPPATPGAQPARR